MDKPNLEVLSMVYLFVIELVNQKLIMKIFSAHLDHIDLLDDVY